MFVHLNGWKIQLGKPLYRGVSSFWVIHAGFHASGMIYLITSSPTIKTPIEVTRNLSQEQNSGSAILQQSWCHWLTVEQPVCKNRVTCKEKVDDSTEHFKTLKLLSQTQSAACALAAKHLHPAGRDWLTLQKHCCPWSLLLQIQYLLSIHILKDFTKVHRIVESA